jgi:hypothetical protein
MSEYMCSEGHLMKPGEYSCPECGGRIYSEDGMSRSEARRQDDMEGDRDGDCEEQEDG